MAKIPKLEIIMKEICDATGIQEGVDMTLGRHPARIYFTFEKGEDGKFPYLNTTGASMKEVFEIAKEYGLVKDKSDPKYKTGNKFALGFKLKPYKITKEICVYYTLWMHKIPRQIFFNVVPTL